MNTALQNTSSSGADSTIAPPPVRELRIEGIKKQDIVETRLAYSKAKNSVNSVKRTAVKKAAKSAKTGGTRLLAERASHQKRRKNALSRPGRKKVYKPASSLRLIETTDMTLGVMMAAKAVAAGLKAGETVLLLSFHRPELLKCKLEMTGLNLGDALAKRKLSILDLNAMIGENVGSATHYRSLFADMQNMLETPVDRIVILEVDKLLNLDSQHNAYMSVSRFAQAADEMSARVIAQYVRQHNEEHDRLDAAGSTVISSYFVMRRDEQNGKYRLSSKNYPV